MSTNTNSVNLPASDKDVVYDMIKKALQRKLILTGLTVVVATGLIVAGNYIDKVAEAENL